MPMHPTADTQDVINSNGLGRRVIGGVRLLLRYEISADGMRGRSGLQRGVMRASRAVMYGLTSKQAGSGRPGVGCMSALTKRVVRGGLKMDAI